MAWFRRRKSSGGKKMGVPSRPLTIGEAKLVALQNQRRKTIRRRVAIGAGVTVLGGILGWLGLRPSKSVQPPHNGGTSRTTVDTTRRSPTTLDTTERTTREPIKPSPVDTRVRETRFTEMERRIKQFEDARRVGSDATNYPFLNEEVTSMALQQFLKDYNLSFKNYDLRRPGWNTQSPVPLEKAVLEARPFSLIALERVNPYTKKPERMLILKQEGDFVAFMYPTPSGIRGVSGNILPALLKATGAHVEEIFEPRE